MFVVDGVLLLVVMLLEFETVVFCVELAGCCFVFVDVVWEKVAKWKKWKNEKNRKIGILGKCFGT